MFKKMIKTLVMVGLVALTLGSLPALAEEESPVSASADVGIFSQYVWRGFALSEDSIVVQPSASVSYGGFGLNLWGNLDTDEYMTEDSSFNEIDMTLSYDWSIDIVSLGVGYIYYGLEGEDSQEYYVSVGLDTILAPSLTIYKDVDTFPGWYVNLGISHSISFTDDMALDLSAAIGYADYEGYSEFHDGTLSASMTFVVDDYISVTPMVAYTFGLTGKAKDYIMDGSWDSEKDHLYGGVTISIGF